MKILNIILIPNYALRVKLCLKEKRFVFKEICGQIGKLCVDVNLSLRDTGKR